MWRLRSLGLAVVVSLMGSACGGGTSDDSAPGGSSREATTTVESTTSTTSFETGLRSLDAHLYELDSYLRSGVGAKVGVETEFADTFGYRFRLILAFGVGTPQKSIMNAKPGAAHAEVQIGADYALENLTSGRETTLNEVVVSVLLEKSVGLGICYESDEYAYAFAQPVCLFGLNPSIFGGEEPTVLSPDRIQGFNPGLQPEITIAGKESAIDAFISGMAEGTAIAGYEIKLTTSRTARTQLVVDKNGKLLRTCRQNQFDSGHCFDDRL